MPPSKPRNARGLARADLPAELTADALRHVNFRTLRAFAQPGNGVLDAAEQQQFNQALGELTRGAHALAEQSRNRARRERPANLDPVMQRSYERTQQRLAQQADRVRRRFPDVADDPGQQPEAPDAPTSDGSPPDDSPTDDEIPPAAADDHTSAAADDHTSAAADDHTSAAADDHTSAAADDDTSPAALEQDVEQTSQTLDLLERIANLQQHQLEHQESKLLSETRGFFFAFLVSIAVIVAGVAPLVEADSRDRVLIILWTLAATAVAGLAYALVRWYQSKK